MKEKMEFCYLLLNENCSLRDKQVIDENAFFFTYCKIRILSTSDSGFRCYLKIHSLTLGQNKRSHRTFLVSNLIPKLAITYGKNVPTSIIFPINNPHSSMGPRVIHAHTKID